MASKAEMATVWAAATPIAGSGGDPGRRTFATLDGLRGIAAIAVVFRHTPTNVIGRWSPGSYHAVDLFFVISGFVLAHAYEERLRSELGPLAFMVQRLIRLYPLYLLGTLLGLALAVAEGLHYGPLYGVHHKTIALALLFLPIRDWAMAALYPLDYPAWSLFFELFINFVFALLVPWLGARLLAAVLVVGGIALGITALHYGTLDLGGNNRTVLGGFGRVGFTFFAGVAAYRLWARGSLPWLTVPAWGAAALVLVLFVVAPPAGWTAVYDSAVALVVLPALVLAATRREPPRWLRKPFAVAGTASYGLYILHVPILSTMAFIADVRAGLPGDRDLGPRLALNPITAVAWVVPIVAAAVFLDRVYDVPMRAALTRVWRQRHRGVAAVLQGGRRLD